MYCYTAADTAAGATRRWRGCCGGRGKLTPHPWPCFEQKLVLENEEATRGIPQSHIVCTDTLATRDVEALREAAEGRLWDIDTGHDLMISEPVKVAQLLLRVA